MHPAGPILVGHGQLPPPPVASSGKKGNSTTVGPIVVFIAFNNVLSPGGQELPEQAGESALPWGK